MKRYSYMARDRAGKVVKGEVEAVDKSSGARLIRQKDLVVIDVKPARQSIIKTISGFRNRITSADVAALTRQLATMVNAGLPVTNAFAILRQQSKATLQPVLTQILADVEGGASLSGAIGRYPKIFSPTYIALIKSGETGGVLDKVFMRLADNLEKQEQFKGKVKGALIYPAIIITGMFIVGLIMMIFVIPRLTSLYQEFDAQLPLPTRILIGVSTIFVRFWPIFVILAGIGYWAFRQYRKTPTGRFKTDELVFKIPIFGELQKQVILTEITRTLALMVGAGVSIIKGLNVTAQVTDNVVIANALRDATKQIERGFPIAYSFAKHPEAFPYLLSQMVAVGEETGKMEEVLLKISRVFEIESDQKVKALTSAIEPIVMILLGVGVGFLVIAIILPIYNLTSQF